MRFFKLCVRPQLYAILQKMRGDFEVALEAIAGRKKRKPITRFTLCGLQEKEVVARQSKKIPSELLLPARVVNRFPSLSTIHINTSVFRSVHHHSQLPVFHSFFSLISFFCVVAFVTDDCHSFCCRAFAHTFHQCVFPSAMCKACPECQGRPHHQ